MRTNRFVSEDVSVRCNNFSFGVLMALSYFNIELTYLCQYKHVCDENKSRKAIKLSLLQFTLRISSGTFLSAGMFIMSDFKNDIKF